MLEENSKKLDNIELGILNEAIHLEPENPVQKESKLLNKVECVRENQINKTLKKEDETLTEAAPQTFKGKRETRGGIRVY